MQRLELPRGRLTQFFLGDEAAEQAVGSAHGQFEAGVRDGFAIARAPASLDRVWIRGQSPSNPKKVSLAALLTLDDECAHASVARLARHLA
jgi:hypothetical protein